MHIQAVVSRANKRANLLETEDFDVVFESQLPNDIRDFLVPLFNGSGVSLQDLERIANAPQHHRISAPRTPVPKVMVAPPKDANETSVVYFLCYLAAALVGKALVVHDIQTRRHTDEAPDIAITRNNHLPRFVLTANFVFEAKIDDKFGDEDHILQAARYAVEVCRVFSYSSSFVVLASQRRVQFIKATREGEALRLYQSKVYELSMHQRRPSEGILALRAFIQQAVDSMTAFELPPLQRVSNDSEMLTLDAENLQLLVCKGGSMVYALNADRGAVLKRVHSAESFQRELEAMKAISSHANVAGLVAFETRTRYLLIDPLGDFNLGRCELVVQELPLDQLKGRFAGLLDGLKHAHTQGWLHRDIRPENIIFCRTSGELVLIDFGLAVPAPTYESNSFSGYLKFAAEAHLDQMINNSEKPFKWDATTDINALFRVAVYVQHGSALDWWFEQFSQATVDEDTTIANRQLKAFFNYRRDHFSESRYKSLDAAFSHLQPTVEVDEELG